MKTLEIDSRSPQDDSGMADMVRQMYDLLGSNMTAMLGHSGPDWRSTDEFHKWKTNVFIAGLEKGTRHVFLSDELGLRGSVSFTAPAGGTEVYFNEVQIRPSSQGDGVTLRRLLELISARIARLPHTTLRTYSNRRNERSRRLIQKAGFRMDGETDRGIRFVASKAVLQKWIRIQRDAAQQRK